MRRLDKGVWSIEGENVSSLSTARGTSSTAKALPIPFTQSGAAGNSVESLLISAALARLADFSAGNPNNHSLSEMRCIFFNGNEGEIDLRLAYAATPPGMRACPMQIADFMSRLKLQSDRPFAPSRAL